jgi:hypothetical protein
MYKFVYLFATISIYASWRFLNDNNRCENLDNYLLRKISTAIFFLFSTVMAVNTHLNFSPANQRRLNDAVLEQAARRRAEKLA